jgi:hypothetical protein
MLECTQPAPLLGLRAPAVWVSWWLVLVALAISVSHAFFCLASLLCCSRLISSRSKNQRSARLTPCSSPAVTNWRTRPGVMPSNCATSDVVNNTLSSVTTRTFLSLSIEIVKVYTCFADTSIIKNGPQFPLQALQTIHIALCYPPSV